MARPASLRVLDLRPLAKLNSTLLFQRAPKDPYGQQPNPFDSDVLPLPSNLAGPSGADWLADITFWTSIQNSTIPSDFQDYLNRFPSGEFKAQATQKLNQLMALPPPRQTGCGQSDSEVLEPVLGVYDALTRQDLYTFLYHWTKGGTFRSFNGITYPVDERAQGIWRNWRSSYFRLQAWTISFEPDGSAVVRASYLRDTEFKSGGRSDPNMPHYEIFRLICGDDGKRVRWAINEKYE